MRRPSQSSMSAAAASHASPRGAAGRASRPRVTVASMRGLSSSVVAKTTTTAQYYGGGEGAPLRRPSSSSFSSNAASTASAAVPPPTMRQRSSVPPPAVSRQPQPQPRPVPMQMQQEPAPRAFLARSDVVDKQVRSSTFSNCFFLRAPKEERSGGVAVVGVVAAQKTFFPLSLQIPFRSSPGPRAAAWASSTTCSSTLRPTAS